MSIISAIILGIVQGLTEFLPVSSSGHLVILQQLNSSLTAEGSNILFDVLLHFATLISVIICFKDDIINLIKAFCSMVADICKGKFTLKTGDPDRRFVLLLIVATIPLVFVVIFKDFVESFFNNLLVVALALVLTGILMRLLEKLKPGKLNAKNSTYTKALIVGASQLLAIVPGLSRSGTTLFTGIASGFDREFAVKFSFIMSIPAILGATLFEGLDLLKGGVSIDINAILPYIFGMAAAFIVGVFAIKFIKVLVKNNKTSYFSYYVWALALFTLMIWFRG